MRYPDVMTEAETLQAAVAGRSLARFGDGELAIARGGKSVSQNAHPKLRMELIHILAGHEPRVLPCVPRLGVGPRAKYWDKYAQPPFASLMRSPRYGSAFITRPDIAPWIDDPAYWRTVELLWKDKHAAVVSGDTPLLEQVMKSARSVQAIHAPRRNAYDEIDGIENDLTTVPLSSPVLIALGAAGTALVARLARKGYHAIDLGHIGQFMSEDHQGAFAFFIKPEELASPAYRELLRHAHATTNWGRGGASWADEIAKYAAKVGTTEVLDYGAGGRTLAPALKAKGLKCYEYDPGVPEISAPPKIADLVVSTDVFEHIEPENVDNVLRHVYLLARKAGYFVIAKQPAKKILADGRNAHLVCESTEWWVAKLRAAGWSSIKVVTDEWKKCVVRCSK